MASTAGRDSGDEDLTGFALGVLREGTTWDISMLSDKALGSLDVAAKEVRGLRTEGASFGMVNVDDEFFVLLRPSPSGMRLLVSDATAALEYDLAADVLDELNIDPPDDDDDLDDVEPWGEGDMAILEDLGLPAGVLEIIVGEVDLFADEQLESVAERMGFGDEYERATRKR